jgi:pimeloyl-ACP methyl ester carboxylesterase
MRDDSVQSRTHRVPLAEGPPDPMSSVRTVSAADGVPLHVELDEPGDAPVSVVLVHGWTLDRRTWGP